MLCVQLPVWLQHGTHICTFGWRSVHKLASLQKVTTLPPKKVQSLLYPFSELEAYLDRSVDRTEFQLFHPRVEDMVEAEKLFCSSPSHKIDYYTSAERMEHVPALKQPEMMMYSQLTGSTNFHPSVLCQRWMSLSLVPWDLAVIHTAAKKAEQPVIVCFIGRSNVGKSSLIRALFSLTPEVEVRVSKTPGHTKKMNFFRVGKAFTIVDMPGYGHKAPKDFVDMVEPYLYTRKKNLDEIFPGDHKGTPFMIVVFGSLVRTFLLVDGSVGLQKADLIALEMCEEMRRPYVMVVTKIDKCGHGTLLTNLLNLQDVVKTQTSSCFPQPFLVSSLQFWGIYLLRCLIAHVTGSIKLTNT